MRAGERTRRSLRRHGLSPDGCRRGVDLSTYAHERARNAINGLRAILERLGSSETPKTLLLVSEGLVVDNERRILEGFARAAAAAHVTLYALKPEPSENDASQARRPALRSQDRRVREEGLQFVSGGGRGRALLQYCGIRISRLAGAASELSGYDLLGFEPAAGDRDGKLYVISAGVRRTGRSFARAVSSASGCPGQE